MLLEFGGDIYVGVDNFMNGRVNGVVIYRNNGFFG